MSAAGSRELVDSFLKFFRNYYRDEIGELAANWPGEQRALVIDSEELYRFDPDIHDDYLKKPEQFQEYAQQALAEFDIPVDVDLSGATVRLANLNDEHVRDVGQYGKRDVSSLLGVSGQVTRTTQKDMRIEEAAFECQRCGTMTYIPQSGEEMQEPHECQGCERQGPFNINFQQSELVDYQLLRLQLPPERAEGQNDETIDLHVEDDLVNQASPGDRVTANMILEGQQKQDDSTLVEFYGDGVALEQEETTFDDMEITDEDIERIKEIAAGTPFEDFIQSIAPSLHGLETEKLAIALQTVGGVRKELPTAPFSEATHTSFSSVTQASASPRC